MTSSNTSVLMVEGAPQNGCCQYLGPQGKFNHIPPLQKTFQDQQVGLTQASLELLLLLWVSKHVRLCGLFFRTQSLFPIAFWLSKI